MMRIIYIDTLFLLNLIVNYLLILATAKIGAVHIPRLRIGLGAFFGAGYAVAAVFPPFGFLLTAPMRLVSGAAMILLAFGGKRGFLRLALIFSAVSAAFGGTIYAVSLMTGGPTYDGHHVLPISLKVLVVAFALCYGVMSLVFHRLGRNTGGKLIGVEIARHDRSASLTGLVDTGNSLVDPVSGNAVLVAEIETLLPLFDPATAGLLTGPLADNPVELLPQLRNAPDGLGLYLLPYTAVGTRSGFLLAFRPDRVRLGGKDTQGIAVALSPTRISDGGLYTALINGGML